MTSENLKLASGHAMPFVGLGTWKIDKPQVADLIRDAVAVGYRHFDCACDYGNEAEVGAGLKRVLDSGACRRQDLWVTSKLWNTYHAAPHVRLAAERSLRDLRLDYLDLYLIHFPIAQKFVPFEQRYPPGWFFDPDADHPRMEFEKVSLAETWAAMEQLVHDGLVKNIGICNYNTGLLLDLLNYAHIPPACLQVELHPYLAQDKLLRLCEERGIAVTAFSPLGAISYHQLGMADQEETILDEPVVRQLADKHQKSPAQILLRWAVERNTAVIPKTSRPERLAENIGLFDFALTADEVSALSALNRNRRYNDPGDFCEKAFNTFCPIYD